jgi:hypothetical protein
MPIRERAPADLRDSISPVHVCTTLSRTRVIIIKKKGMQRVLLLLSVCAHVTARYPAERTSRGLSMTRYAKNRPYTSAERQQQLNVTSEVAQVYEKNDRSVPIKI